MRSHLHRLDQRARGLRRNAASFTDRPRTRSLSSLRAQPVPHAASLAMQKLLRVAQAEQFIRLQPQAAMQLVATH